MYQYPDTGDKVTLTFITHNEPFHRYWEKSEKYVLNLMKKRIQSHINRSADSVFLDAGCGTGRLLPEFKEYFSKLVAIDPDSSQVEKARNLVSECGFADKVTFQATSIDKLECDKETFDAILCSHVLQHVHTNSISLIMQKFEAILKNQGLLFITTTHSTRDHDYFVKAYLENCRTVEKEVEKDEFDTLILNRKGILPIHFFALSTILELLRRSRFELLDFKSYHFLTKIPFLDRVVGRERLINSCGFLKRRLGRDMLVVARKTCSKVPPVLRQV